MTKTWTGILPLLFCLALAVPCPAREGGAYEELDTERLGAELGRLGMTELLNALTREMEGQGQRWEAHSLKVSQLLNQTAGAADAEQRTALLDKAVAEQRQVIALLRKVESPSARQELDLLEQQLRLAEMLGQNRVETEAWNEMHLLGGPDSRRVLYEHSKEAGALCNALLLQLRKLQQEMNLDMRKQMLIGTAVEDLAETVGYRSAWIFYNQAISSPDQTEKSRLLNITLNQISKYVLDEQNDFGVRDPSRLLAGRCYRELGSFNLAEDRLRQVDHDGADALLRMNAKFERVRLHVERGRSLAAESPAEAEQQFAAAAAAIKDLLEAGRTLGKDWELSIDLQVTVLKHYLYTALAETSKEEAKQVRYRREAQEALVSLLVKYDDPTDQMMILELLSARFVSGEDPSKLDAFGKLVVASREIARGESGDLRNAVELLEQVVSDESAASSGIRPIALWQLASAHNILRQNAASAAAYLQLATDFPQHKLAYQAAQYAALTMKLTIQQLKEEKQIIRPEVREQLLRATGQMLYNPEQPEWAKRPESVKWCFDDGWQAEQLAEDLPPGDERKKYLLRAKESYRKVPRSDENQMQYLAAKYYGLRIESKLLEEMPEAEAKKEAGPLAERLVTLSKEAEAMRATRQKLLDSIDVATDGQGQEAAEADSGSDRAEKLRLDVRDLRNWAAEAAYVAARLYGDRLDRPKEMDRLLQRIQDSKPWEEAPVIPKVWDFRIRHLLDTGRTQEALGQFEEFRKLFPKRAETLVQTFVANISIKIDSLRDDPLKAEELNQYKTVYVRFARDFHRQAEAKNLPEEQMTPVLRLLADALLTEGSPASVAEAMTLVNGILEREQAERQKVLDRIEQFVQGRLEAAQNVRGNVDGLRLLVREYFQKAEEHNLSKTAASQNLRFALQQYERAEDPDLPPRVREKLQKPEVRDKALEQVHSRLVLAWQDYGRRRRQSVPRKLANVRLKARALWAGGKFGEALQAYQQLTSGLRGREGENPDAYWRTEYEQCQCWLQGFGDNRDSMQKLLSYVRYLEVKAGDRGAMGGLRTKFTEIKLKAEQLAR